MNKLNLSNEIITPRTVIRRAIQEDLPKIAAWPDYPWPHEVFNMTGPLARHVDQRYWWERLDQDDRYHYSIINSQTGEVIGVHALIGIDWKMQIVGNMGIRIRSDLCSMGLGTETLKPLLESTLMAGMKVVRLDVAGPNARAIRCYEKSGMRIVDEFWQEHNGETIDLLNPKWVFAKPHLQHKQGKWLVRLFWMECKRPPEAVLPAADT
jgi:RimJ/RimL family protein N-acetyltransferase